jgi:hypothetical protein
VCFPFVGFSETWIISVCDFRVCAYVVFLTLVLYYSGTQMSGAPLCQGQCSLLFLFSLYDVLFFSVLGA